MSKINNINFDDGIKEFSINDDPNRTIRFNPKDINLVDRLNQVKTNATKKLNELKNSEMESSIENVDETLEIFNDLNKFLIEQIDMLFGAGTGKSVFGEQSPLTTIGGKTIFERFLEATISVIEPYIQEEVKARDKAISKYKGVYDRISSSKS